MGRFEDGTSRNQLDYCMPRESSCMLHLPLAWPGLLVPIFEVYDSARPGSLPVRGFAGQQEGDQARAGGVSLKILIGPGDSTGGGHEFFTESCIV